jgi:Kinesin motor domain
VPSPGPSYCRVVCSVFARIRPCAPDVQRADWRVEDGTISQPRNGTIKAYHLDQVFAGNSSTEDVYINTTQSLVKSVADGFNCTVFAYGQTSSGKTHTMRGTPEDDGIIGRAVSDLFESMRLLAGQKDFSARASYMEVRVVELHPSPQPAVPAAPPGLEQPCPSQLPAILMLASAAEFQLQVTASAPCSCTTRRSTTSSSPRTATSTSRAARSITRSSRASRSSSSQARTTRSRS